MPRNLSLTRTEAESLVDLLEACDPKTEGTWRHELASEIRELFGMVSLREEKIAAKNMTFLPPIKVTFPKIRIYPGGFDKIKLKHGQTHQES